MDVKTRLKNATDKLTAGLMPGTSPEEADILDTLKKEHDEVQELLSDLNDSSNARERKSLVAQIKKALLPHTKAEEKTVYDAVIAARTSSKEDSQKQKQDGTEGYMEHALASQTLAKLEKLKPDSVEFLAAAKVLKELVDHHVKEEERNIWSDVKNSFDSEERVAMNRRFLAAKKRVKV
ncbi:MAG TPA: hemerythrin domain-containing protein [Rhizomicrobium sp.]|nr:hemerythrin domain-containing protein [Rhizomicrobium sp.]